MEINRFIFNKLLSEIQEPFISILLGARQVGKSTLLKKLEREAQKRGAKTVYFNLELSSDLVEFSGTHDDVVKKLSSQSGVIFIDEFHYLKNASKIFKAIYDSGLKIKIYASGSSSMEIHKHLKESLAGRFRKTMIYPLSWSEWQQLSGKTFADYCQWGGMPGLIHLEKIEPRVELLENIVSTYLTKDVKALVQEENVRAFNQLLYMLAQNQGSVTVVANLAREVGLSEPTLTRYLELMAHTYVCFQVPSFSGNLANEIKKSRKCYLFDLGIRNSLLKDFLPYRQREDAGAIFESFVFQQLQTQLKANMEIRFWRTKKGDEVDFIVVKNRIPYPVEVKSSVSDLTIPRGLQHFLKFYKKAPMGIVLNTGITGETIFEGRPVHFLKVEDVCNLPFMESIL